MLVRAPDGTYEFIDFRETAPAAAFQDMYEGNPKGSTEGGLARYFPRYRNCRMTLTQSSGVPGELRGLEHMHTKYGVLPWSTVVQPAIRTAREGFPVTEDLVSKMESATDEEDFLSNNPAWAIDFAPNGTRLGLGDTITRKRYADTLEAISQQGVDAFYSGPIAEAMINALRSANGTMTLADLRNYTVAIRDTSEIDYRGYKVTSTTAPTSGIIALGVLNTLNEYSDLFTSNNVNLSTHRMDEAIRFGYGQVSCFPTYGPQAALTMCRGPNWAIPFSWMEWRNTRSNCYHTQLRKKPAERS